MRTDKVAGRRKQESVGSVPKTRETAPRKVTNEPNKTKHIEE